MNPSGPQGPPPREQGPRFIDSGHAPLRRGAVWVRRWAGRRSPRQDPASEWDQRARDSAQGGALLAVTLRKGTQLLPSQTRCQWTPCPSVQTHRPGLLGGQEGPLDESWPDSCERPSVSSWATPPPASPQGSTQAANRSSRQPLHPGNRVHRQGSRGAQGRCRGHTQVALRPSKQDPPAALPARPPPALSRSAPPGHCLGPCRWAGPAWGPSYS